MVTDAISAGPGGTGRRFLGLFGLGVVGVVSIIPTVRNAVDQHLISSPDSGIPAPALVALSLVNPLLLLALSVFAGIKLAPRLGLVSRVDQRVGWGVPIAPGLWRDLPLAVVLGVIGGMLLIVLDIAFVPWTGTALRELESGSPRGVAATLQGMLYGGITEELMLRWGMMSFLAWIGWRVLARRTARPPTGVFWGAILGSAVAFGFGHLPALAALVPLTPPIIVRTVVLNAVGGVVFGWLFWRRSLEAAMIAHATVHIVFTVVDRF